MRKLATFCSFALIALLAAQPARGFEVSSEAEVAAALRCASVYGVVMETSSGAPYDAALQGRLDTMNAVERRQGSLNGPAVVASDDAATAELKGAAAKLRAAVQACDARFGLNVASGIPKPQAPYVPPPPPEQSVQTFENTEAPSPSPAPSGPSACERIDKRATELMDIWTGHYAAYAADPTYDHLRSLRSDYDNIRSRLEWALRDAESADCYDLARDMRDVLGKWEKPY